MRVCVPLATADRLEWANRARLEDSWRDALLSDGRL